MTTMTQIPKQTKYLTFILGEEEYGFDALKVEGILSLQPITPIPNVPPYFRGVTTVRGRVAPIVSARLKLGMTEIGETSETCIILVTLANDAWAGLVVDTVRDVVDIGSADFEPPPSIAGRGKEVIGLAKSGEHVRIILDVEVLLADINAYTA